MHTFFRCAAIGLLTLSVGLASAAPSLASSWCTKGTTLTGLDQRFRSNFGPDLVVRVDLAESLQQAVDIATDVNGDGYIIVAAVSNGNGDPNGFGIQRVVVDRVFSLPFGLFGCSLTLIDPNPADGLPTIHIAANAAGPDIFAMDLHGTGSNVAGWRVEGNGRYIRNAYARDNAIGYWFTGDGNTLLNGVTERSAVAGVRFEGSGNAVVGNKIVTSDGVGIEMTGDHNGDCEFSVSAGNWNAAGNKANGITIAGRDGDPFPTGCLGTP